MSDQPSFELGDDAAPSATGDEAAPRPVNDAAVDTGEDTGDNHGDRKQLPLGTELRATICRAVWDAAVALEPVERAWIAAQHSPSDRAASPTLEYNLSRLPTTNGEGIQLFAQGEHAANGLEVVRDRVVELTRSWSADPLMTPRTQGVASIDRWQRYDFAGPNHCDKVWTSVTVYFDPVHSVDALKDLFGDLRAHSASFELEAQETTFFQVYQCRTPSPEELLHLAKDRLQPDMGWQRNAITNPWPGFTATAEELVDGHGIILSEPFEAWRR